MKSLAYVVAATIFEAAGDAVMRVALQSPYALPGRIALFALASFLLTMYGSFLNLAPARIRNCDRNLSRFIVRRISNRQLRLLPTRPLGWRPVGWNFHTRWCSDHLLLEVTNVLDAKPLWLTAAPLPVSASARHLT